MKQGNVQHAIRQHATPKGFEISFIARFYKHFNPMGLDPMSHSPTPHGGVKCL
jgi:hypothetical protein